MSLTIAAALLLFANHAAGECPEVRALLKPQPSSQNIQITVLVNGKPQKDVQLLISTPEGPARLTGSTDSQGKANLSNLPPGNYCIAAKTSSNLRDDLCLAVSRSDDRKLSPFSMNLSIDPLTPPTYMDKVDAAEKTHVSIRAQNFAGIVWDPAGAVIPNAEVAIYKRGAIDKLHPVRVKTGESGHFSVKLAPGIYTAVFTSWGFRTELLVFEITPGGSKEDLKVGLKVGSC
jgi:hypothetical protein